MTSPTTSSTARSSVGAAALLLAGLLAGEAQAQVHVQVNLPPPPSIRFEVAPPLLPAAPGVQVVANHREEVFFTAGWFWTRRDGTWFRTRDVLRPQWVAVDGREVPPALVRLKPGVYVNWHGATPADPRPPPPPPPPPPPVNRPPPVVSAPPPSGQIIRTKELRAGRIRARVIYAKEIKADDGRIGRIHEGQNEEWEKGRGEGKLDLREVNADVIYAKEVRADWIEASEIHAKDVRIGSRAKRDDDDRHGHGKGHGKGKGRGHDKHDHDD